MAKLSFLSAEDKKALGVNAESNFDKPASSYRRCS
jgi:hypothetical protein